MGCLMLIGFPAYVCHKDEQEVRAMNHTLFFNWKKEVVNQIEHMLRSS
jgi:hypothetical protein